MNTNNYVPRLVESYAFAEELIARHMVFLAGPRQTGKTMLAKKWLRKNQSSVLYFNWDDSATRRAYFQDSRFFESPARTLAIRDPWIVFDAIHKRKNWRDILKGAYDLFNDDFRFLITGSARLDLFRKSGDSLVGRYNLFHLFPFNIRELVKQPLETAFIMEGDFTEISDNFTKAVSAGSGPEITEAYEILEQFGPFPEPLLKQKDKFCRKWHTDYFSLLIQEDLRDISRVTEIDKIENLLLLLPDRLTSPLSMPSLARDLEAAHTSIKNWLEQLKKLYLIFSVSPWSEKINRSLKKEKKWYFLDWYYAPAGGAKQENLVASNLYRYCHALTDTGYGTFTLHYVRTLDKREIDFLIVRDKVPIMAIEVKSGDTALSGTLQNRKRWFPEAPTIGIQLVNQRNVLKKHHDNTWVMSVERLLSLLI
ncbi:MAG: ATP-binding protein [Desulfobulbaceae bacterium]|nr:ATP-binding protein [Desulfobulbaceae bacterium]